MKGKAPITRDQCYKDCSPSTVILCQKALVICAWRLFLLTGCNRLGRVRIESTGGYQREPCKADEIPRAIWDLHQLALLFELLKRAD